MEDNTNGNKTEQELPSFILTTEEGQEQDQDIGQRAWKNISKDPLSTMFFALYVLIALATFRHTTIGFASLERGSYFWGALAALAIDAGLMLSATGLRTKRHPIAMVALVIGLLVSVTASAYSQLLFSVMYAQAVTVAPGAVWLGDTAIWIIEKRVVIMSVLLPFLAVGYSFAAKSTEKTPTSRAKAELKHIEQELVLETPSPVAKPFDLCTQAWHKHGLDKTAAFIAKKVGCHLTTANRARLKIRELAAQEEREHETTT